MKKHISFIVVAWLFAVQAFSQNTFDAALTEAVADLRLKVPSNAAVAVPHVVIPREVMAEQSAVQLSDYLIAELSSKLVNTRRFKVLERQKINMDAVQASLDFDLTGDVSDASAQGIGRFLGAEYLVIGSLRMIGQELRLYVETVKVEEAQQIASYIKPISRSELSAFYSAQAWTPPQPASFSGRTYSTSNTGVYVGIVSFGDGVEDLSGGAPIFLDAAGLTRVNGLLDNGYKRTSRNGTLLFYGVHRALASLSANAGKYPQNLNGVYLVTFTDGLDAGSNSLALSPMENLDFSDKLDIDYQAYLKGQIANRPVAGRAITAYSAGVRGSDVQDIALFRSSLSSLASGASNFYELSNFSQLNSKFDEIAQNLTITTANTTFELRTPSFSIGTKIRMTFDNVSGAASSSRYVEGTVAVGPSRTYALTNIVYGGTSSDNGSQIAGVMNGTEVIYTFSNFTGYNAATDKQVKQWTQRNGSAIWQVNSEYEAANSTITTVEHRSAVVYIALDASRSLSDSDVIAVRAAMKQFVQTLYERSQNQSAPVVIAQPPQPSQPVQPTQPIVQPQPTPPAQPVVQPQPTPPAQPPQPTPRPTAQPQPPSAPPKNAVPDGFVRVNGGTFTMGEKTSAHQVTLSSYYMGKYEVTQKEYQAVMGSNPSKWKGDNLPVECVSWHDAIEYCNKRSVQEGLTPAYRGSGDAIVCDVQASGYRLPTEAEWEYAAKGGNKDLIAYEYAGSNGVDMVGWYSENSDAQTHMVGMKLANVLGLYDMSGNVWEWCWDWYASYSSSAQTNPMGASSGTYRILRGGSWYDTGQYLRSTLRGMNTPTLRDDIIGFRLFRPL